MESWRARRKEQREEYESSTALWTNTLTSATINTIQMKGTLAAEQALKRLQAATAAKQAANAAAISGTDEKPSGFTALENIAARYRDIALGSSVDVTT